MNRLDLVFSSPGQSPSADSFDLSWRSHEAQSSSAATTAHWDTAELITRPIKRGASIRRLRNHRCTWPRRF